MQNSESGIPVLTEVLHTPMYGVDLPERRSMPPAPHPPAMPEVISRERLENEVTQAVLEKLLGQLDQVLEARIRDQLADVLQTAVDGLACQLRAGLKQALDESIALAVAAELAATRNAKIENMV
jgi:hypothetical protein